MEVELHFMLLQLIFFRKKNIFVPHTQITKLHLSTLKKQYLLRFFSICVLLRSSVSRLAISEADTPTAAFVPATTTEKNNIFLIIAQHVSLLPDVECEKIQEWERLLMKTSCLHGHFHNVGLTFHSQT